MEWYKQHCFGSSDAIADADKLLKLGEKLTEATVELQKIVMDTFVPSSSKFQYQFNLRDLKNISEGLCRIDLKHPEMIEHYSSPINIIRMWIHEVERVFLDRIVLPADITRWLFMMITKTQSKIKCNKFCYDRTWI